MLKLIGTLHREGISLVAGTDALAGFAYQRELELYERPASRRREAVRR